jgi:hypothetical protein
MVTRFEWLARSTHDLLNTKKAGFCCSSADSTKARCHLMLTVLGRLPEFERGSISARTGEGREGANAASNSGAKDQAHLHQQLGAIRPARAWRHRRHIARNLNLHPKTISGLMAFYLIAV